ncbi:MAG: alpha/beta fold hydrolase [Planctomycetota bacterium]
MERTFTTIEQGQGFPLVLLHGLMGEPENWENVFPHLPDTCRSIALRFPFFEDGAALDTIPAITDYARQYLRREGFDRMALVGNSLGGHVGLHLAMEMPDKIAGLVLTGSSGLYEREIGRPQGANPSRQWYYEKMCEIFHDPVMVTDEMVDRVQSILAGRRYKRTLVSIAKSAKRDNLADQLPAVTCPVLLVWGKQDEITPPDVADDFKSLLPNCELAWLDKCGHAPMMEQPKAFGEALSDWWRRIGSPEDKADDLLRPA